MFFGNRPHRLKGFDYSKDGWYFFTARALERKAYFGTVQNGSVRLNACGEIVWNAWLDLPNHYPTCTLDEFVVMPNHVHGIVRLCHNATDVGATATLPAPTVRVPVATAGLRPAVATVAVAHQTVVAGNATRSAAPDPVLVAHGLPELVRAFKSFSSRRIHEQFPNLSFQWKRSFGDWVLRDNLSVEQICDYIRQNPAKWKRDGKILPDPFL